MIGAEIKPLHLLITSTLLFTMLALVGGEVFNLYEQLWWWDIFLHMKSGWFISLVACYLTLAHTAVRHPLGISLIAMSVAINVGVQWELLEYTIDQVLGWNMQASGLDDTMYDLLADSVGAAIGAAAGYRVCAGKTSGFVTNKLNQWSVK